LGTRRKEKERKKEWFPLYRAGEKAFNVYVNARVCVAISGEKASVRLFRLKAAAFSRENEHFLRSIVFVCL